MKSICVLASLLLALNVTYASNRPWVTTEYPQDVDKWWWDDAWWNDGKLPVPSNYDVVMEKITYMNGDTEVPAYVFKPKKSGRYLPVLFQHGRRGLDDLTLGLPRRLAARGFIVLAPDVWSARFIEKYPLAHDYDVETDTARGIEV